jgi:hypothetical protein
VPNPDALAMQFAAAAAAAAGVPNDMPNGNRKPNNYNSYNNNNTHRVCIFFFSQFRLILKTKPFLII